MAKGEKKSVSEMTTEELAQKVFGKKLTKKLKDIAHEGEEELNQSESSQDKSST